MVRVEAPVRGAELVEERELAAEVPAEAAAAAVILAAAQDKGAQV